MIALDERPSVDDEPVEVVVGCPDADIALVTVDESSPDNADRREFLRSQAEREKEARPQPDERLPHA